MKRIICVIYVWILYYWFFKVFDNSVWNKNKLLFMIIFFYIFMIYRVNLKMIFDIVSDGNS